jgi:hypothetical protein
MSTLTGTVWLEQCRVGTAHGNCRDVLAALWWNSVKKQMAAGDSMLPSILYCIVLHCTVLYCIVLYCTVLYCIVLYCTVLYSILPSKCRCKTGYRYLNGYLVPSNSACISHISHAGNSRHLPNCGSQARSVGQCLRAWRIMQRASFDPSNTWDKSLSETHYATHSHTFQWPKQTQ